MKPMLALELMTREELIAEVERLRDELRKPKHKEEECHVCTSIKAKQESLIGYVAALGLRADEQGDQVARTWAAEAIKQARE